MKVVTDFVVEFLSNFQLAAEESFEDVHTKVQDYFDGSTFDASMRVCKWCGI